jgi:hypothetical protein
MVKVKRGGRWVSVKPGQDVSTISGGSGTSSFQKKQAQQKQINQTLADMRAGKISREAAAARVKTIQRGVLRNE